jgi:hypothetical protein
VGGAWCGGFPSVSLGFGDGCGSVRVGVAAGVLLAREVDDAAGSPKGVVRTDVLLVGSIDLGVDGLVGRLLKDAEVSDSDVLGAPLPSGAPGAAARGLG